MAQVSTGGAPPAVLTLRPVLAAPVPQGPDVRPGSFVDAKRLRARLQQLLQALDRADETIRVLCQQARDRRVYLLLEGPDGRYFRDWTAFVTAPVPWGLGVDGGLVDALVKERRDPQRRARLVLERPDGLQDRAAPPGKKPRRPRGSRPAVRGTEYDLFRLKRDHPEILQQLADGEIRSIREAAELAGLRPPLVTVLVDPMNLARLIVTRLDDAGQREVIRLVQHPREITAPGGGGSRHWEAFRERTTAADELARERAQASAEKAAHREAYMAAYDARRRQERQAQRAQAAALGLPSLAVATAP
jgi:hypothetical protein